MSAAPIGAFKASEAEGRWCPLARIGFFGTGSVNRHPMDSHGDGSDGVVNDATCRGPDCALWRPIEEPHRRTIACANPEATAEGERPDHVLKTWTFEPYDVADGDPACWLEPEHEAAERARGYCGAGGPLFWPVV